VQLGGADVISVRNASSHCLPAEVSQAAIFAVHQSTTLLPPMPSLENEPTENARADISQEVQISSILPLS
jgi:hypothetical protein